ncbi:Tetraspanin-15 [Taenia solium]|eukprot:TsM_000331300 transcript=TsM_000331300 gene=TsM_000331300
MGRNLARIVRTFFQVVTAFFLLGFLILAVCGIVIQTSASVLQSAMTVTIDGHEIDAEDARQLAALLLEIADAMAIYCIVFGVVMAIFSLIGLIASCRGWYKVLKIYAIILGVLLVVQIIVVAVVFSNPTKFANKIVSTMEELLKSYTNGANEENKSNSIWNVLMKTSPQCCGMDGYKDFEKLGNGLPLPCCNITTGACDAATAQRADVAGCRSKVELISTLKSAILLRTSIAMIIMHVLLIALVVALIFTTKDEETI